MRNGETEDLLNHANGLQDMRRATPSRVTLGGGETGWFPQPSSMGTPAASSKPSSRGSHTSRSSLTGTEFSPRSSPELRELNWRRTSLLTIGDAELPEVPEHLVAGSEAGGVRGGTPVGEAAGDPLAAFEATVRAFLSRELAQGRQHATASSFQPPAAMRVRAAELPASGQEAPEASGRDLCRVSNEEGEALGACDLAEFAAYQAAMRLVAGSADEGTREFLCTCQRVFDDYIHRLELESDSALRYANELHTLAPGLLREVQKQKLDDRRQIQRDKEAFDAARRAEEDYLSRKMKDQGIDTERHEAKQRLRPAADHEAVAQLEKRQKDAVQLQGEHKEKLRKIELDTRFLKEQEANLVLELTRLEEQQAALDSERFSVESLVDHMQRKIADFKAGVSHFIPKKEHERAKADRLWHFQAPLSTLCLPARSNALLLAARCENPLRNGAVPRHARARVPESDQTLQVAQRGQDQEPSVGPAGTGCGPK